MKRIAIVISLVVCLFAVMPGQRNIANATTSTDPFLVWQGNREYMHVWRAQVTIKVQNASNSGTDDSIFLSLNYHNITVLDKPGIDDFEPGSVRTYDLLLDNLWQLGDIKFIRIASTGSDTLDLDYLQLRINNKLIYSTLKGNLPPLYIPPIKYAKALWISSSELRGTSSKWSSYSVPPRPKVISSSEIYNRIVSVVSTKFLHKLDFEGIIIAKQTNWDWNGTVKLYPMGDGSLQVSIPYKIDVGGTVQTSNTFKFKFIRSKVSNQYAGIMDVLKTFDPSWNSIDGDQIGAELQRSLDAIMGWRHSGPYGQIYFPPYYHEVLYPCKSVALDLSGQLNIEYDIMWGAVVIESFSYQKASLVQETVECIDCVPDERDFEMIITDVFAEIREYEIGPGSQYNEQEDMALDCYEDCVDVRR